MAERKTISKKIRFEVFKRDNFTCQYCGRKSPNVVLEVDHIKPVKSGGKNSVLNLVTSCFECNRGKGKRELSDSSEVEIQRNELELLNKKREQMKMMIAWKEELSKIEDEQIDSIEDLFSSCTGYKFSESFRREMLKKLKDFGYGELYESMQISISTYYHDSECSADKVLSKLGGICYNRRMKRGY